MIEIIGEYYRATNRFDPGLLIGREIAVWGMIERAEIVDEIENEILDTIGIIEDTCPPLGKKVSVHIDFRIFRITGDSGLLYRLPGNFLAHSLRSERYWAGSIPSGEYLDTVVCWDLSKVGGYGDSPGPYLGDAHEVIDRAIGGALFCADEIPEGEPVRVEEFNGTEWVNPWE